jgi:hypothetical protein
MFFSLHAHAADIYDLFTVKWGVVEQNEMWQGKILFIGDVRINAGVTIDVAPGTWLVFSDYDVENMGADAQKPELIIDGNLHTATDAAAPIEVLDMHDARVKNLLQAIPSEQSVEVKPQTADVRPLFYQWNDYAIRYAYLWAIFYSLWLVF